MPADRNDFAALLTPKVLIIVSVVVAVAAVLAYIFISQEAAAVVGGGGGGLIGLGIKARKRKRDGASTARGATETANDAGETATDVLGKLGDKEGEATGGKDADTNDKAAHSGGGGKTLVGLMLWMGLAGMTAACLLSSGCAAIDWSKAVTTHVAPPSPEAVEEPAIVQGHTLDCPRYVLTEDGEWHASAWFASGPTLELDVSGTMLPGYDRFQLIPTPITTMDATVIPTDGLGCTFIPVAPNVYSYYLKLHRAWGPRVAREAAWQEYAIEVTESYGALQVGADEFVKGKAAEQRIAGVIVTGVVATVAAILGGKIGWDLHAMLAP